MTVFSWRPQRDLNPGPPIAENTTVPNGPLRSAATPMVSSPELFPTMLMLPSLISFS